MRRGQDFSRTTKTGHRVTSEALVLYFLVQPGMPETPQIGLIINKSVGGSVTRHRIARQLRHQVASHLTTFPKHSQLVIRVLKDQENYRLALDESLNKIFKKIEKAGVSN